MQKKEKGHSEKCSVVSPAVDGAADEEEVVEGAEQHGAEVDLQLRLIVPEHVVDEQIAQQRQQEEHQLQQHELHVEASGHDHQAEGDVD
jgi:hypothetical protein